jgi:hypothetical protein
VSGSIVCNGVLSFFSSLICCGLLELLGSFLVDGFLVSVDTLWSVGVIELRARNFNLDC